MKWSNMKIVLMAMLVAGILLGLGRQGRSQDGWKASPRPQKTEFEKTNPNDDIENFVRRNYSSLAIDTSGPEPEISIIVETNGDFSCKSYPLPGQFRD